VSVSVDWDAELAAMRPDPVIRCRRCGTPYTEHAEGGPVSLRVGGFSSPAAAVPVTCPGFAWVDPAGPPVSYGAEPSR
jgi:hypothetical protein